MKPERNFKLNRLNLVREANEIVYILFPQFGVIEAQDLLTNVTQAPCCYLGHKKGLQQGPPVQFLNSCAITPQNCEVVSITLRFTGFC